MNPKKWTGKQWLTMGLVSVWSVDTYLTTHNAIAQMLHVSPSLLAAIAIGVAMISEKFVGRDVTKDDGTPPAAS